MISQEHPTSLSFLFGGKIAEAGGTPIRLQEELP